MDILDVIGDFGRYQKEVLFILSLRSLLLSFTHYLAHVSSTDVDYWCKPPEGLGNITSEEWKDCCLPKNSKGLDRCHMFEGNGLDYLDNSTYVNCHEWEYEKDVSISMKSEWNLVCGRTWLMSQIYAMFYFGNLVSYPIAGFIADRIGRRTVMLLGCAGLLFTNTALYFSSSLTWFLIIRLVSGLPYTFLQSGSVTSFMEITNQKGRSMTALFTGTSWSLFSVILLGVTMLTTTWRQIVLISSFPIILPYLVLCWRYLPESPRWLIASGQTEKAKKAIFLAAKKNGIVIHELDNVIKALEQKAEDGKTQEKLFARIKVYFSEKKLILVTCVIVISSCLNTFTSHGYYIVLGSLGGNFKTNFIISSSLMFIGSIISYFILSLFTKRRRVLMAGFITSGLLFLLTAAIGQDSYLWLRITLATTGNMCTFVIFHALALFVNEVFPTQLRARGFSLCMTAGRIGALFSSYVDLLSHLHGPNAPYYLFGSISLLTATTYFFVPEMDNKNLPDSLKETRRNLENASDPDPSAAECEMELHNGLLKV